MAIRAITSLEGPDEPVEIKPRRKVRLTKEFESSKSSEQVHFTYRLTPTDQGDPHDLFFEDASGHTLKVTSRTTEVARSGTTVRHDLQLIRKSGNPRLEVYEILQVAEDSRGRQLEDSVPINAL